MTSLDRLHMERALLLAARGRGRTSPNPVVGAVVADGPVVVGAGYHEKAGTPHAEVYALGAAGERAKGATLYCTLEPCCHVGRTGPCVERVVAAGVRRVVAAVQDPNPVVSGGGFEFLRAHGIEVEVGVGREEALRQNRAFFTFVGRRRPFVIVKAACSADGYIARRPGERTPLTSAPARGHAHSVRAEVDAIAVGSGTVLADDPLLTAREVYRHRPLVRVIFDRRLRTPPSARILATHEAGPVVIFTTFDGSGSPAAGRLRESGALVEATDGTLAPALARLAALDVTSLVVEGGAALHGALWESGAVDYVQLYVSSTSLGGGVPVYGGYPAPLTGLVERRIEPLGADTLIEGYVHRVD